MQALITLPSSLTTLPQTFTKISKTVYHDNTSGLFYKLTILQPVTLLSGQDLLPRQNIIFTPYNPSYLVLQILASSPTLHHRQIPGYLTVQQFRQFTNDQGDTLIADKSKIMDYLEHRIDAVVKLVEQRGFVQAVKKFDFVGQDKQKGGRKPISNEIVQILRKDIAGLYLDEILITRYHEQHRAMRPVVMDNFVEDAADKEDFRERMKNKKKSVPKPIVQSLPSNQPTLFQFSQKKK